MEHMEPQTSEPTSDPTLYGMPLADFIALELVLEKFTHATGRCAAAILREFTVTRKDTTA